VELAITCSRCGQAGDPPPGARLAHLGADRERVLAAICANCWREWEGAEVKVINEHRLNFMDPQHREMLKRACLEFLGIG
jgi:Fe-S cluster biosynthesis and repair protein YggX